VCSRYMVEGSLVPTITVVKLLYVIIGAWIYWWRRNNTSKHD